MAIIVIIMVAIIIITVVVVFVVILIGGGGGCARLCLLQLRRSYSEAVDSRLVWPSLAAISGIWYMSK